MQGGDLACKVAICLRGGRFNICKGPVLHKRGLTPCTILDIHLLKLPAVFLWVNVVTILLIQP